MPTRIEPQDRVLAETPYLRLIDRGGWAFVQRPNVSGIVVLVAVTSERRLLLVEQVRPPLGGPVIELPAGLAGDGPGGSDESLAVAAQRELEEETGYRATRVEHLLDCVTSPGLSDETVSFFLATGLQKTGPGGGVGDENISVHEVPLDSVARWLREKHAAGIPIAAKVLTGLQLLAWQHPPTDT